MLRFLVLFWAVFGVVAGVRADAVYTGTMRLSGMLGEDVRFEIFADYYGNGPVVVSGETVYHRKNGKKACIKVYGSWDIETDGQVHLYEMNTNRVCGNFHFTLENEPRGVEWDVTRAIEGYWQLGEKILPFMNVTADNAPEGFPDYCRFLNAEDSYLRHADWDWRECSGAYGFYYAPMGGGAGKNWRMMCMDVCPDSTCYHFAQMVEEKDFSRDFRSHRGYGHQKGVHLNGWVFSIGNAEYDLICMEDVILVYRTNPEAVPDGALPKGVKIEGVYPRMTRWYKSHAERRIREEDPESATHCDLSISVPYTIDAMLTDSIKSWVCRNLNWSGTRDRSYIEIAEAYTSSHVEPDEGIDEEEIYDENWKIPYFDCDIECSALDDPKYVNMNISGSDYFGGAHGFPYNKVMTIVRSTGREMTWKDWFVNPEQIESLVSREMRLQNEGVEFDGGDILSLPVQDPWLENGYMHFMYQPYEAAPYCYGMPDCSIEVGRLKGYMKRLP